MKKRIAYKVRNWSEYNRSLVNRGNITLWVDENAIESWIAPQSSNRGRPFLYSDSCILCRVGKGVTSPSPSQIRTCAIHASGSSNYRFAEG